MTTQGLRQSPLALAARHKDIQAATALLQEQNATQAQIDSALSCALCYGNEDTHWPQIKAMADLLLRHGANVNAFESDYGPIVFGTGECHMPKGLAYLIQHGADVSFKPVDTKYGKQCPLSYWLGSYARGQNERKHRGIAILLEHDVYIPPGITPPILAIHQGDTTTLAQLLEEDPSLVHQRFADMPYGNIALKGATLLHAAAEHDEIECCKVLLAHGADINSTADTLNHVGGQTPIFHVINTAYTSHLATLQCLVDQAQEVGQSIDMSIAATFERYGQIRSQPTTAMAYATETFEGEHRANMEAELLILENLDRPVITDPHFKAAVKAIQTGDLAKLKKLLNEHPNLATDHAIEPAYYRQSYFRDPALLWFVANNPNLITTMPANTVAIAQVVIEAGATQADLDYTLGLVMTSLPAREQNYQQPLMKLLVDHGAKADDQSILGTLAHKACDAVGALLKLGQPVTAAIAAGMGMNEQLPALLVTASPKQKHDALAAAVINGHVHAAALCLAAGAPVNERLPAHAHSWPVHQATMNDDVPMLQLLIEHGAKLDVKDTLWQGTPLGWANHCQCKKAKAYLEAL